MSERERFALFSGGHDSLCSTHLSMTEMDAQGVVHINTGIGIDETREFVRQVSADQGWPLHELHSEAVYEDLVLERGGFPSGPQSHNSFYWHLKQKPLRAFVQSRKRERSDVIGLVTGIRKAESVRRMTATMAQPTHRTGAMLWINPILDWSATDKNRYMAEHDLPRNQVTDTLHRSGECLCGALARREELREIAAWYPKAGQRILNLEARVKAAGIDDHLWASRSTVSAAQEQLFDPPPLCVGCFGDTPDE